MRAALALSKTPFSQASVTAPLPLDLDTGSLEKILRLQGTTNGGVYQFSVPRLEAITQGGMSVSPSMGTAIAINFQRFFTIRLTRR